MLAIMSARERLAGAIAKIERAEEQIRYLNSEATAYFSKPTGHTIVGRRDQEDSRSAMVGLRGPNLPIRFSILIGEVSHQLRSSLDHLLWQLVIANNVQPDRWNEFPIYDDPIKYESGSVRKVQGLSGEAKAFIKGYQPYKCRWGSPHEDPLWIVHETDRIDKHRLLVSTVANASYTSRFLDKLFFESKTSFEYLIQPPHEVDVDHYPVLSIALNDVVDGQPVVPLLSNCTDWIKRLLDEAAIEFF